MKTFFLARITLHLQLGNPQAGLQKKRHLESYEHPDYQTHTHTNLSLLSICSLRSIYTRDYSEYFLIHVNRYQSALQTLSDLSCLNCHKQLTQRPLSYSFENGKLKYKSPNSIVKYINAVLKCNANLGRGRKKSLIDT